MKKRKWNRVISVLLVMVTEPITYVRMWKEERKKMKKRYDHSIFMEHKAI